MKRKKQKNQKKITKSFQKRHLRKEKYDYEKRQYISLNSQKRNIEGRKYKESDT